MKYLHLSIRVVMLLIVATACKTKNNNTQEMAENKWKLMWSEEFDGDQLDTEIWNRQIEPAGRFNEEWQRYTDDVKNAYVENGQLVMVAIYKGDYHGMGNYTSARLNTAQKKTFKYGKIAARIKLPKGNGIWPAFWTLGNNIDENGGDTPWPFCGEIDILELYGSKDDGAIEANIHYANKKGSHESMGSKTFELEEGIFADDFHVFELEWNEQELIWYVDGKEYARTDITGKEFKEFHKEHFLLLNIAVGGKWSGKADDSTGFPQKMYVDWIRHYEKG
ncbi:MAG: glycoside hydrolase family 16 protein [Nonlabens sp.]